MSIKKLSILLTTITIMGCSTIIGGFTSTSRSSGSGMGPATIGYGDMTLSKDKFQALTIESGNLTVSDFTIKTKLNVDGNVSADHLTVNGNTIISNSLIAANSSFMGNCTATQNINSSKSYFAKNIEFGGTSLILEKRSKVIGDIISTSNQPVTIIIDHSLVKGIIGFVNPNSKVIIQNKGHLVGRVFNGTVQDLTGSDNYEGDDNDFAESDIATK